MHRTCHGIGGAIALAASAHLGGCGRPLNMHVSPGSTPLEVYAPGPGGETSAADVPSLDHGHDRSHWPLSVVTVPIDVSRSQATYTWRLRPRGTPRERGLYPNAALAIAVDRPGEGDATGSFLEVGTAAASIFIAPVRMIVEAEPWSLQSSPRQPYDRLPHVPDPDPERWFAAP